MADQGWNPEDRLDPTPTTLKELFAKSGNQCAFPACLHPIVDEMGNVVAHVAHIIGVRQGSPRYAPIHPEEKRDPSNLLLLCYAHHKVTDDENRFPVARMREIKEQHERRFGGVVTGLSATMTDQTAQATVRIPEVMERYEQEYGLTPKQGQGVRENLIAYAEALRRMPPDARSVLAVIVERGDRGRENSYELTIPELRDVLGVTDYELGEQLGMLKRNGFVDIDTTPRDGYHEGTQWIYTVPRQPAGVGPILDDVRGMHEATGNPVSKMLVELNFTTFGRNT